MTMEQKEQGAKRTFVNKLFWTPEIGRLLELYYI